MTKTAEQLHKESNVACGLPKDGVCLWKPNPGPQTDFLQCGDREVLYGGSAGSGKSDALLMAAARHYKNRAHRAIIFRKTFGELKDLIRRSEEIYPAMGGRYTKANGWRFRSGASVEFGYLDKKKDVLKYKRAWNFIGFDELTHWEADGEDANKAPINANYLYLIGSRLRSVAGSGLPLEVRATTNPGGPGHAWVRHRFNIPDDGGQSEVFDPKQGIWRLFIPGRIKDCPQLAGTSYETDLEGLPEDHRKMLKDGRWDVMAGAMFTEFDHRIHTCAPFPIPQGVRIWRGADDGYNAPASILWFAEIDKRIYVISQIYRAGMNAERMAEEVLKRDKEIEIATADGKIFNTQDLSGAIDPSAFNEAGVDSSGTGRAQRMNVLGCKWSRAQKGPGSRVAGCSLVHSLFMKKLLDGKPALVFFKNCTKLISTITQLEKDVDGNIEDVKTDGDDHSYDSLRYGLQLRQKTVVIGRVQGL